MQNVSLSRQICENFDKKNYGQEKYYNVCYAVVGGNKAHFGFFPKNLVYG